jgi:hypothetical protein
MVPLNRAENGELLRALTLDPTRDYQPLGGRWPVHDVLRHDNGGPEGHAED